MTPLPPGVNEKPPVEAGGRATRGRPTALVVDDDARSRRLVRALLDDTGYDVREAPDGASALEAVRRGGVDLVVSDVLMPVMDGYRFAFEARRAGSDVAIVLMTGTFMEAGDAGLGLAMGADAVLAKPFDRGLLAQVVGDARRGVRRGRPPPSLDTLARYADRLAEKLTVRMARIERDRHRMDEANEDVARLGRRLVAERTSVQFAIETTTDGVVAVDAEGIVRFANGAAARALGRPGDDLAGGVLHDVLHPYTRRESCALCAAVESGASLPNARDAFSRADGTTFHVALSLSHSARPGADAVLVFREDAAPGHQVIP